MDILSLIFQTSHPILQTKGNAWGPMLPLCKEEHMKKSFVVLLCLFCLLPMFGAGTKESAQAG